MFVDEMPGDCLKYLHQRREVIHIATPNRFCVLVAEAEKPYLPTRENEATVHRPLKCGRPGDASQVKGLQTF